MQIPDLDFLSAIISKPAWERTPEELARIANAIRQLCVSMVAAANSGHPGGPLGLADIYAVLYFGGDPGLKTPFYRTVPAAALDSHRDRILLSNGHVCAVKYAAMALAGFHAPEELASFRALKSRLQGHPSTRYYPELDNSSGSLGQGLANAGGLGIGLKLQSSPARVWVGMSDGECQEGMTWEAAMAIAHHKATNVHPFLDWNNIQIDGFTDKVMNLGELDAKFRAFGWETQVAHGHDIPEILKSFSWSLQATGRPRIILFRTVLGKGVSYMENNPGWHGTPPNSDQLATALQELQSTDATV